MGLNAADILVVGTYFVVIAGIGLWFGRGERDTRDFFLGGRRESWIIAGLSVIATELSALTFVTVPADAYRTDCSYLQLYFGAVLGRLVIVFLLLPAFYGGSVTTVYEYLGQRFGPWSRTVAATFFLLSQMIGSGIRLMAASLAIAVVFEWNLTAVVFAASGVVIVYTTFGGIKAIMWTDAFQTLIFLAGGSAMLAYLFVNTPGNAVENLTTAWEAGKLRVFHFSVNLNDDKSFWVLLVHATFLNITAFGTDQNLTQRMLTCRNLRDGKKTLLLNLAAALPITCLFLGIGVMMYVYCLAFPEQAPPTKEGTTDHAFAYLIRHLPLGWGLKGLLLAGVFATAMSTLDSSMSAMSTTVVVDFYRPFLRRGASEAHYLLAARLLVVFFGVALAGVALLFAGQDQLLWEAFRWAGLIFGPMLGVFLLAVLTKTRGHDRLNVATMLTGLAGLILLRYVQDPEHPWIAWPWWVVVGAAWTFCLGLCVRSTFEPLPHSTP